MRLVYGSAIAVAFDSVYQLVPRRAGAGPARRRGGRQGRRHFRQGMAGKIDAQEEKAGQVLNNARLAEKGGVLTVRTGPR